MGGGVRRDGDLSRLDPQIRPHVLRRTMNPGWLPDVLVALSGRQHPHVVQLGTLRS
jgi:hypothetical protein